MRKAERRLSHLTQGLELVRRLEVAAGLRAAAQDAAGGRLVLLEAGGRRLLVHGEDGWARGSAPAPVQLSGLVALPLPPQGLYHFVGWGPAGLALLGPDLRLLSLSTLPAARALCCCALVPESGLLVAGGPEGLTLWELRAGGRRLALRRHLEPTSSSSSADGLPGPLARLALKLPAPPGALPLCFATYGSALATFDLEKGLRLDVRRELHKTTISDVAYCEAAGAVVTASRDSTVKVWEAQWQLRKVFVGHMGPVTALAVLPSTPRVLSASRDGTLRTWDLDAGEQVGEVTLQAGAGAAHPEVTRLLPPARPGAPVVALGPAWVELWRLRELYVPLAALPAPVLALQAAPPICAAPRAAFPRRLLCLCRDRSVRLLAAPSGRPVAALQLDDGPAGSPAAAAYCLVRETLLVLTGGGGLLRVNVAVSPVQVVQRVAPPPAPAPRPCRLHLYHHLPDPAAAQASWSDVRLRGRELRRRSCKPLNFQDRNRFLPVLGYEDGSLSVLDWLSARPLFHTAAHGPGPVSVLASCAQTLLSTGADLTVKMWRVYPYAEESLTLLRSFPCCHPAVGLCLLGTQLTVAFEAPGSATYGLVQYGLQDGARRDHRPQDDPTDHITGLCCCPALRIYACSSLDRTVRIWTAQNQLLRILYLDTAPQDMTFCNDKGDLVLALGSHLCLLPHTVYLPTAYLIKVTCQQQPESPEEPPPPSSSEKVLTPAHHPRPSPAASSSGRLPQEPGSQPEGGEEEPKELEDREACAHLAARNQDLQLLAQGQVSPTVSPAPRTRRLQDEAFHSYLALLYGPALPIPPPGHSDPPLPPKEGYRAQGSGSVWTIPEFWEHHLDLFPAAPRSGSRGPQMSLTKAEGPEALVPRVAMPDWAQSPASTALGKKSRQSRRSPGMKDLEPPALQLHSAASLLLAKGSLCSKLGLSLDLQLADMPPPGSSESSAHSGIPGLLGRRAPSTAVPVQREASAPTRTELSHSGPGSSPSPPGLLPSGPPDLRGQLSPPGLPAPPQNILSLSLEPKSGFGPSTLCGWARQPAPCILPGFVPNSVVLQQLWPQKEMGGPGKATVLAPLGALQRQYEMEEQLSRERQRRLLYLRPRRGGEEQEQPQQEEEEEEEEEEQEEEQEEEDYDSLEEWELDVSSTTSFSQTPSRQGSLSSPSLPSFLLPYLASEWFQKLFPGFSLQAFPEASSLSGLVNLLLGTLPGAAWAEAADVLQALLFLLPQLSLDQRRELQDLLFSLLNQEPPPGLLAEDEKRFVLLALHVLMELGDGTKEVVLELMAYFLSSPITQRAILWALLGELGLRDPHGFLRREMEGWVQAEANASKARLKALCEHHLDGMIQELKAHRKNKRSLPEGASQQPPEPQDPLVRPIDALNFFCEQKLEALLRKEIQAHQAPNAVVPLPWTSRSRPLPRLQETKVLPRRVAQNGHWLPPLPPGPLLSGFVRALKLPLPRVEPLPFPPGWPLATRPLPPLLLEPTLQRYFLPHSTHPDSYP
ncbi:WD repeat-containing protein 97 [Tachyglossus aculeatus]|uniref:WD repeat-containing protein 97 n=1 Tax=Tachyglossus aculeatus TaxID=9261 RepID=UPI0018F536C3|nr:WD repeat-containing protein 97 [Tachyglossus aculeatus]